MTANADKFKLAIERFDAANREDPTKEVEEGQEYPKELLYAQRMTHWLQRLAPGASEPLRLAARCQHICRWMIPRNRYPMDRDGYHQWRTTLANFHAEKAGQILREVGYDEQTATRVQSLVRKEHLKSDPETQLLEDVICLVFLESHFESFAKQHDEGKLIHILRRIWTKMSRRGQQAALELELPQPIRALIEKAFGKHDVDKP